MKHQYCSVLRVVAIYLIINIVGSIVFPTVALALTSGTSSPEFSGFTPVGSTEMVNTFTGDFAYSLPVIEVPGPQGSGYSMALTYNSGSTGESESSWVGLGWSLNPGSINRSLRGFPDEYKNKNIDYYNKTRPNWTATAKSTVGFEVFSSDMKVGFNYGFLHRINNYTGYQKVENFGMNFNGAVGLDASKDANGTTYSPYVSASGLLNTFQTMKSKSKLVGTETQKEHDIKSRDAARGAKFKKDGSTQKNIENNASLTVGSGNLNLGLNTYSVSLVPSMPKPFGYPEANGFSVDFSMSLGVNPAIVPVGIDFGKAGTFSFKSNRAHTSATVCGYSNTNSAADNAMRDYFVEKNRPFNTAELNIGIPFGNYDIFNVTGEGVCGSYRSFLPALEYFTPAKVTSQSGSFSTGFEVMLGTNIGAGFDLGLGYQRTDIDRWSFPKDLSSITSKMQPPLFRFSNDLGGEVVYNELTANQPAPPTTKQTAIQTSNLDVSGFMPGSLRGTAEGPDLYKRGISGTSAPISELKNAQEQSTGMSIVNKDGVKFLYEEPLLVRNETSLSVDVPDKNVVKKRFLAFQPLKLGSNSNKYSVEDNSSHHTVLGQIDPNSYASSYLLTGIVAPSYIDSDRDNKLSDNDFGGWTKFGYRTILGSTDTDWYRYRMPFKGLYYQQNAISDVKDDLGSVETGEKQVKYLYKIETKTHVAYFITNKTVSSNPYLNGSQNERYDGSGALALKDGTDPASVATGDNSFGSTRLEYLEKIVLFAKEQDIIGQPSASKSADYFPLPKQKPLKTVRFAYDYSLVGNVDNNVNCNSNNNYRFNHKFIYKPINTENGKLTLRKVWVEYEGVVSAKISPYVFNYLYPNPVGSASKLAPYFGPLMPILTKLDQNPNYAPYACDVWGNMSPNCDQRRVHGIPWCDQSAFIQEPVSYDPAAYQLKSIKLPSGGTIYVQYEAKDYAYVQDRSAMAMARVKLSGKESPSYDQVDTYTVNVEDLGVDTSKEGDVKSLNDKINAYFQQKNSANKIYFKFLFGLLNNFPTLDDPHSEYITGYTDFVSASMVTLPLSNGGVQKYGIEIKIGREGGGKNSTAPRKACSDLVMNQRQGKLDQGDCIESPYELEYDDVLCDAANGNDAASLLKWGTVPIILGGMAFGVGVNSMAITRFTQCDGRVGQHLNPDLSFVKLPTLYRKVGGGARVKRILLCDTGIEDGDEVVLGTEYTYKMEDGKTSSGVATNEPSLAREENPLITFMPLKGQTWWDKLISGETKDECEGPLGESLLPGASIGYRRVVIENIHKGKTGNGYSIDEYNTVYDYPFDKYYARSTTDPKYDFTGSANQKTDLQEKGDDLRILTGLINYVVAKQWATQGFMFIQTNMHGVPKRQATYSGSYLDKNSYLVSGQDFEYFQPGEKIKVVGFDDSKTLKSYDSFPGKEMDVAREDKTISDVGIDFTVEVDISCATFCPPPVFVGVMPSFSLTQNDLSTNATTKVISYPTILKSTTKTVSGVSSKSENKAFDVKTGDAILVKNTDSYCGAPTSAANNTPKRSSTVYTLSIPANWIYSDMGQKANNDVTVANLASNTNQLNPKAATFVIHSEDEDKDFLNASWLARPSDLVSAVITRFGKNWGDLLVGNTKARGEYGVNKSERYNNSIFNELNKKRLPLSTYTYKSELDAKDKAYNKGVFSVNSNNAIQWFGNANETTNFNGKDFGPNWIKTSETTLYSPNGEALEEKDVLGVPSAALYGKRYRNNVPTMVAKNTDYNSIFFEDFETYQNMSSAAHSGKYSQLVEHLPSLVPGLKITSTIKKQGALVDFWMNKNVPNLRLTLADNDYVPSPQDPQSGDVTPIDNSTSGTTETREMNPDGSYGIPPIFIYPTIVATVDGWTLYQAVIPPTNSFLMAAVISDQTPPVEAAITIAADDYTSIGINNIDDIRFQPLNSSTTCFVYDYENLRLLTQFDDQHFGTYFLYDLEGKLTRKIIETERGKQAVQETHYNIPTSNR